MLVWNAHRACSPPSLAGPDRIPALSAGPRRRSLSVPNRTAGHRPSRSAAGLRAMCAWLVAMSDSPLRARGRLELPDRYAVVRTLLIEESLLLPARAWATTGIACRWEPVEQFDAMGREVPALVLPVTPDPWCLWLGLLHYSPSVAIPLILFKNLIPFYETGRASRSAPVQPDEWAGLHKQAITRNPGLDGLFALLDPHLPWVK